LTDPAQAFDLHPHDSRAPAREEPFQLRNTLTCDRHAVDGENCITQ
jgi:hypothetical protein